MPEPAESSPVHTLTPVQAARRLGIEPARGLADAEVTERRSRFGDNRLAEEPPERWWVKLLRQFHELVIYILIAAAVISGLLQEWIDTFAILAIVILNGILGFLQEEKAGRALAALQGMSAPHARVRRGGELRTIDAGDLVPGDVLMLEAGDNISADGRLLESFNLRVAEAALTGESVPVEKSAAPVLPADAGLGDRVNMVHMGTAVSAGRAEALVTGTGMNTELGRIAGMLRRTDPEPTPLQRRLAELGKVLVILCLAVVAIIFTVQVAREGTEKLGKIFLLSVSLAVAAVPEGLPAVVTMVLALGLQRMVKRNALIRKLPAVETLGSVTVVCSDKTGTLTRNEMTVRELLAGGKRFAVSGTGYEPVGAIAERGASAEFGVRSAESNAECRMPNAECRDDLTAALATASYCNTAELNSDGPGKWRAVGDPTEIALLVAARKGGVGPRGPGEVLFHELPFDSDRKAMTVAVKRPDGSIRAHTKGAPEMLVSKCSHELIDGQARPLTEERRKQIAEVEADMASHALRVLALAHRDYPAGTNAEAIVEADLVFAGLAGMIDPPREEVKVAVARCREAGIKPVMITGDHPATAQAIARELGIAGPDEKAIAGAELDRIDDAELQRRVESTSVYARVAPEHKLRIVKAWKARGHIVAMTGDGVNDAPAVKAADIGIAMGITGTDVTKAASDMVLVDDNFTSIVNAVEEGRGIFDNIQKFIDYLLSCNAGEIILMFVAAVMGWPAPLAAVQLLWINLVTDGLPALALGMEPPEADIMKRSPRPPHEPVITRRRGLLIAFYGTLMAAAAGVGFRIALHQAPDDLPRAETVAFCVTALCQLGFSLSCRSRTRTMPELGIFSNPYLLGAVAISGMLQLATVLLPFANPVFKTVPIDGSTWGMVLGLSLVPVTLVELGKLVAARRNR